MTEPRISVADSLARISALDNNAILTSIDNAPTVASTGPLAGVPIVIKDNIDVVGFATTAGCPAFQDVRPTTDAPLVTLLRNAGASIVGKANMHELAAGVTSDNGAFGPVRNPHSPAHVAGGSSGGSAAAVAADLVDLAVATDTGGSSRIPASFCGVVGFRPSTGRWPAAGVTPISPTRDTPGACARSVAWIDVADQIATSKSDPLAPVDVATLRLGIPRAYFWNPLDDAVAAVCEAALDRLRDAGVTLVDVDLTEYGRLDAECGFPIALFELNVHLTEWMAARGLGTLPELQPNLGSPDVAGLIAMLVAEPVPEHAYRWAIDEALPRMRQLVKDAMGSHRLDAIAFPTSPVLPPLVGFPDTVELDGQPVPLFPTITRNTGPASIIGAPGISLPCGWANGLPVGLEFDGAIGTDRHLLALGAAVETIVASHS
jgi:indoleacetamide hydrolase